MKYRTNVTHAHVMYKYNLSIVMVYHTIIPVHAILILSLSFYFHYLL